MEIINKPLYPICIILSWLTSLVIQWPFSYLTKPIVLVLAWVRILVLFVPAGPVIFVWTIILFVNLLNKRMFKKALLFACTSAYFVILITSSAIATVSYLNGSATLSLQRGCGSIIWRNLDRDFRCYKSDAAILGIGDSLFLFSKNLVVKTLIKTFGPMKGAYTGYYPTEKQATEILGGKTAENIDYRKLEDKVFEFYSGGMANEKKIFIPEPFNKIYKNNDQFKIDMVTYFLDLPIKYTWNIDKRDWERIKSFRTDKITIRFKILNKRAFLIGDKCYQILYDVEKNKIIARFWQKNI